MFNISEELQKLPDKPGVYIMKDESQQVIYVGKAISLKNRVRQYFQKSNSQGLKVRNMVGNISEFEYIIVDNEIEALVLESNLIKKHKPKYNILLRDDKQYPYIKVTIEERYPRVVKTREVKKDGGKYFGPYPNVRAVNNIIDMLHEIYPIRTCKLNLDKKENIGKYRPCLNYFIDRCKAPCQGWIKEELYREMIDDVLEFLDGKTDKLIQTIESKMLIASKSLEFEKASLYRDQLEALKILNEEQKIVSVNRVDQDIIGLARGVEEVCIQVFFIRAGKIIGREHFFMEDTYGSGRKEILSSFIKQFYSGAAYVPKEIILDTEIEDKETVEKWLSTKRGSKVGLHLPQRGEKLKLVEMVNKNARDMLNKYGDRFLKERRKNLQALDEIKESIGLEKIPLRIEAYDISNISGLQSVGSMVVFENGEAKKSDYRRFKIEDVGPSPDDYKSMKEVIYRRFKRGLDERKKIKEENLKLDSFSNFPDLIMIDGGKGQVNVSEKVLRDLSLNIPVAGLVKDDFHKTRGIIYKNKEYNLDIDSLGYRTIYKIQEEAHRFALNYHKTLRKDTMFKSQLDGIKHIGPKRKRALMEHFKGIENIKNASIEELLEVKNMSERSAKSVHEYFNREVDYEG